MISKFILFLLVFTAGTAQVYGVPRVYFSPNGDIQSKIIECIDQSVESIDVMCFSFTSRTIAKRLIDAKERGVRVRVILDLSQTEDKNTMYGFLKKNQVEVKRISAPKNGIMHNKVAVFDNKTALTGSYNWTGSAERYNYENAVFLDDNQSIFDYKQQFEDLWNKASDNASMTIPKREKKVRKANKAGEYD